MLWLAGALFLALSKIAKKFTHKHLWWLPFTLFGLAILALALATIPLVGKSVAGLVAALVSYPLGWFGGLIGVSASMIATVLLVLVLIAGIVDLVKDRTPDAWAKRMVFAVPVLVLIASGPIAVKTKEVTDKIGNVGPTVVQQLAE